MISRYMLSALIIAAFPRDATADAVIVQQFIPVDRHPSPFVVTLSQQSLHPDENAPALDLAADFAGIAMLHRPESLLTRTDPSENSPSYPSGFAHCTVNPYRPNPALPVSAEKRRATWYGSMVAAACDAGIPVDLFDALIIAESRYNPVALSPKGAAGLAQLMPASAIHLGVSNVWDPSANLRGGAQLLRALLDKFRRFDLALAAYNAGAGRVRSTWQVPLIPETLHYVAAILTTMRDQTARTSEQTIEPKARYDSQRNIVSRTAERQR